MWGPLNALFPRPPEVLRSQILAGRAGSHLRTRGALDLSGSTSLIALPRHLQVFGLDVSDCAQLRRLPVGLRCEELLLRRTPVTFLPPDLRVGRWLDAEDCRSLKSLPPLELEVLCLRGCQSLESLPDGLEAASIDLSGCHRLNDLPPSLAAAARRLQLAGCASLRAMPTCVGRLDWLDVRDCAQLHALPEGIAVRSWIDVAGSGLAELPWSLRSVRILWRGVEVSDRIAFHPDSIDVAEVLYEPNLTLRRVLLERIGIERFMAQARAVVVDRDEDRGGIRRLLRVPVDGAEDLAFIEVHCPSTRQRYFLAVPPRTRSCREGIAWTAGLEVENYRPVVET